MTFLLLHGAGHSKVAWDDQFCARLDGPVIRFDARDAGQARRYPVGDPGYTLRDLVSDAVRVLDEHGVRQARLLGMSQGAAVAQLLALDHPDRVRSLALHASTPGGPGHTYDDLPAPAPGLFDAEPAAPDWSDREAVIDYLIEAERPFAAAPFDENAARVLATRLWEHAGGDLAGQLTNPYLIDAGEPWRDRLGTITAPTVVFHGDADPFLPIGHGHALSREIPGARFVELPRTGHQMFPAHTWGTVVSAMDGAS